MDDFQGLREAIGDVIVHRRTSAGLTQSELAGAAGLERSYLSLLEHGKRMPGVEIIYRLAKAFGIKPTTLFSEIHRRWEERGAVGDGS